MNITLTPEAQRFIEEQVKAGRYQSADDVLDDALSRMIEEESSGMDEETLNAIDESDDQIERGEFQDWKQASARFRSNGST